MDVVHFLFPETLTNQTFCMPPRLPDLPITICQFRLSDCKSYGTRKRMVDIFCKLSPCKFAKIKQCMLQTLVIKILVKYNYVHVVWHNHICINLKAFFLDAKIHAIQEDLSGFWIVKNRQPIDDCKGNKIDIYPIYESKAVHKSIILEYFIETSRTMPALGRETGAIG
jgi:hypothetical protein